MMILPIRTALEEEVKKMIEEDPPEHVSDMYGDDEIEEY